MGKKFTYSPIQKKRRDKQRVTTAFAKKRNLGRTPGKTGGNRIKILPP